MAYSILPQKLQEKVRKELNENPDRIPNDLRHIREWMAKQPHLFARKDDQTLIDFLRNSKFSLERAKEKIDAYYTVRSVAPELFEKRDPFLPEVQELLNRRMLSVVEDTSNPLLPVVVYVRWEYGDPEKVPFENFAKIALMALNTIINTNKACVINGFHVVGDMKDLPFNYITQMTPAALKKLISTFQDAYPLRLKGVHMINLPSFFENIVTLIKSLFKEKLRKRTHSYGTNYSSRLQQHIPVSLIPNEYGGTAGSLDEASDKLKEAMESQSEWFAQDSTYGTDETKRIGNTKMSQKFGLDGSFRSLTID